MLCNASRNTVQAHSLIVEAPADTQWNTRGANENFAAGQPMALERLSALRVWITKISGGRGKTKLKNRVCVRDPAAGTHPARAKRLCEYR